MTASRSGFGMPFLFVLPSPARPNIVSINCSSYVSAASRTSPKSSCLLDQHLATDAQVAALAGREHIRLVAQPDQVLERDAASVGDCLHADERLQQGRDHPGDPHAAALDVVGVPIHVSPPC